jgi:hypothetical protein
VSAECCRHWCGEHGDGKTHYQSEQHKTHGDDSQAPWRAELRRGSAEIGTACRFKASISPAFWSGKSTQDTDGHSNLSKYPARDLVYTAKDTTGMEYASHESGVSCCFGELPGNSLKRWGLTGATAAHREPCSLPEIRQCCLNLCQNP